MNLSDKAMTFGYFCWWKHNVFHAVRIVFGSVALFYGCGMDRYDDIQVLHGGARVMRTVVSYTNIEENPICLDRIIFLIHMNNACMLDLCE